MAISLIKKHMKKFEGLPTNLDAIESATTPLKASIESKIDEKQLSGVMMQEVVDGLASGKIKDREGAEQLLRETFFHNPFDGKEITLEQKNSAISEAMSITEKQFRVKDLEKQINVELNGIFDVIDVRQSRELFYGTKGNKYLDRANQLVDIAKKALRDYEADNNLDETIEQCESILKEAKEIFQEATLNMNKKKLEQVRRRLGLPSEEKEK